MHPAARGADSQAGRRGQPGFARRSDHPRFSALSRRQTHHRAEKYGADDARVHAAYAQYELCLQLRRQIRVGESRVDAAAGSDAVAADPPDARIRPRQLLRPRPRPGQDVAEKTFEFRRSSHSNISHDHGKSPISGRRRSLLGIFEQDERQSQTVLRQTHGEENGQSKQVRFTGAYIKGRPGRP